MVAKFQSDLRQKICRVNLAIALKFGKGDDNAAKRLLDCMDISAALPEFKLAKAVLNDDFAEAAEVMLAIGKAGQLVGELAYHTWPLFKRFRESEQFRVVYEKIYGVSYVSKLEENIMREAAITAAQVQETQQRYESQIQNLENVATAPASVAPDPEKPMGGSGGQVP